MIVKCQNCNQKNRINVNLTDKKYKCGKCKTTLIHNRTLIVKCTKCNQKNQLYLDLTNNRHSSLL